MKHRILSFLFYFTSISSSLISQNNKSLNISKADTNFTNEEYTKLFIEFTTNKNFNPAYIDTVCLTTYFLNEKEKYREAIINADRILNQFPYHIGLNKEKSLAYAKLNIIDSSTISTAICKKAFYYSSNTGKGSALEPINIVNVFEGFSIIEMTTKSKPKKAALLENKNNQIIVGFQGYSSAHDEYYSQYFNLNHCRNKIGYDEITYPESPNEREFYSEEGLLYRTPAKFPGGNGAMFKFLENNLKRPAEAKKLDFSDVIVVYFTINEDGSISDCKVQYPSECNSCDKAAINLIKGMPKWEPAKIKGKKVKSREHLPIFF